MALEEILDGGDLFSGLDLPDIDSIINNAASSSSEVPDDALWSNLKNNGKTIDAASSSSSSKKGQVMKRKSRASSVDPPIDERRLKHLERNRAAATRCRERKKQWLQQLQQKAATLTTSNRQMHEELKRLRDEVLNLKGNLVQQQGPNALERAGIQLSKYSDPNFDFEAYTAQALAEQERQAAEQAANSKRAKSKKN
ncbi:uncharacterized protein MONBRDRAFT_37668 [Monosiga brevicollis MX1]|uniref:BZIP domain-containing protein n=1 Tax=Monosiga brevicollis TaxID=81824 RepID=A9V364_MONBE|nr:uncharacterized protein MONBRDRAFT_37668 [Monosiga brevicollis MX1]EDQ88133.1 predicted protein [Monosiga brevicollis MX1]|eukprot:XP_001747209.1 hypothetical protein [Monosiga brevicollis MX1]